MSKWVNACKLCCNKSELDKAYQQGREDTINEFMKRNMDCTGSEQECMHYNDDFSCVECIAEQMREEN